MSLTEYNDLEQGTEAWFDVRRGIVTASTVGRLITPKTVKPAANPESRALVQQLAAERITGWTEPTYRSDDMLRGVLDEPVARSIYALHYAPVREVGFMVRDDWGFRIGFSPDGLVGDDGLIEVKSFAPKRQLAVVLGGTVPPEHMAQVQCGLLVSGRKWLDYLAYCGGLPLWKVRVERDERWADAIVAAVAAFEDAATHMVTTYQAAVDGLPETERIDYDEMVI